MGILAYTEGMHMGHKSSMIAVSLLRTPLYSEEKKPVVMARLIRTLRGSASIGFSVLALSIFALSAQAGSINLVQNPDFALFTVGSGNFGGGSVTDWTLYPSAGPLGLDLFASNDTNANGNNYESLEGGPFPGDGTNTNFAAIDATCCEAPPVTGSSNPTVGPLTQMLTLMGGQTYVLSFDYAAAQLITNSMLPTAPTCEQWIVSIGGTVSSTPTTFTEPTNSSCPASTSNGGSTTNAYMVTGYLAGDEWTTPLLSIPGYDGLPTPLDFSGWYTQTETFTVPGSGPMNELLSFFAAGSAIGAPPMDLVDNVSITATPEPATYTLMGAGLLGVLALRGRLKRRR